MLDAIVYTYCLALPAHSAEEARTVVDDAIERARAKHRDFDRFLPAIDQLSKCVFTDHRQMPLDAYLEVLYCGVKHGDFSREWRAALKRVT